MLQEGKPGTNDLAAQLSQITLKPTDEQDRIKELENENSSLEREMVDLKQKLKTLETQLRCYETNEFEVADILDDKFEKGKHLYLVRWKHFGSSSDSWEKETNLKKCPEILAAYLSSKPTK